MGVGYELLDSGRVVEYRVGYHRLTSNMFLGETRMEVLMSLTQFSNLFYVKYRVLFAHPSMIQVSFINL